LIFSSLIRRRRPRPPDHRLSDIPTRSLIASAWQTRRMADRRQRRAGIAEATYLTAEAGYGLSREYLALLCRIGPHAVSTSPSVNLYRSELRLSLGTSSLYHPLKQIGGTANACSCR
jgi:hypothetical protein